MNNWIAIKNFLENLWKGNTRYFLYTAQEDFTGKETSPLLFECYRGHLNKMAYGWFKYRQQLFRENRLKNICLKCHDPRVEKKFQEVRKTLESLAKEKIFLFDEATNKYQYQCNFCSKLLWATLDTLYSHEGKISCLHSQKNEILQYPSKATRLVKSRINTWNQYNDFLYQMEYTVNMDFKDFRAGKTRFIRYLCNKGHENRMNNNNFREKMQDQAAGKEVIFCEECVLRKGPSINQSDFEKYKQLLNEKTGYQLIFADSSKKCVIICARCKERSISTLPSILKKISVETEIPFSCKKCPNNKAKIKWQNVKNFLEEQGHELLTDEKAFQSSPKFEFEFKCPSDHITKLTNGAFMMKKSVHLRKGEPPGWFCITCREEASFKKYFEEKKSEIMERTGHQLIELFPDRKCKYQCATCQSLGWSYTSNLIKSRGLCPKCRMHDPETKKKIKQSAFKMKTYTFPSGKEVEVMGYEGNALTHLLTHKSGYFQRQFTEENLEVTDYGDFKIDCTLDGTAREYYPDIRIKDEPILIEVKSSFTFDNNIEECVAKCHAAVKAGYTILLYFFDRDDLMPEFRVYWPSDSGPPNYYSLKNLDQYEPIGKEGYAVRGKDLESYLEEYFHPNPNSVSILLVEKRKKKDKIK